MNQYWATLDYYDGAVEPVIGETLTGGTSTNTGVVLEDMVYVGCWAGGDAEGRILLEAVTGWDRLQFSIFTAAESITGSTGGTGMMAVDNGTIKVNNRLSPEGEMAYIEGAWWCRFHYDLHFPKKYLAEATLDLDESARTQTN
jgi:hypothetical protein